MGRFRLVSVHDDSDDDEEVEGEEEKQAPQHWEFVGEPGEEGALVVREDEDPCPTTTATTEDDETRTSTRRRRRADEFWGRIRPPQRRRPSPDDEWETDVSCPNDDGDDHQCWEWVDPSLVSLQRQRSRSSWRWLWILSFTVVLIAVLWKDPPPAPPRSFHEEEGDGATDARTILLHRHSRIISWGDYLGQHGRQLKESAVALGLHTPWHVLSWWIASMAADLQLVYERLLVLREQSRRRRRRNNDRTLCRPSTATGHNNHNSLQHQLHDRTVGQPLAVEWVTEAVHAWNRDAPLVVWAVGYPHTGKRTLARQLAASAEMMSHNNNCRPDADAAADANSVLLQLQGSDWRIEDYHRATNDDGIRERKSVHTMFRNLVNRIALHVQRQPDGFAMILLTRVEDMEASLRNLLMEALFVQEERDDDPSTTLLDDPTIPNLRELCRNTIIYLTCSSGNALVPITRALRASGGNDLRDAVSLPADLRDALVQSMGLSSRAGTRVTSSSTILPFGPLTPDALAQLLRRRVADYSATQAAAADQTPWKSLRITDAAVEAFLDPRRVEYLEWRRSSRSTGGGASTMDPNNHNDNAAEADDEPQHFMTVALEGAKVLDDRGPIMTKITAQTKQMLALLLQQENANSQQEQLDKIAVLDYDTTNPFVSDSYRGVLKWCDEDAAEEGKPSSQNCQTVLRFRV